MAAEEHLPGLLDGAERICFTPTRDAGLARLDQFVGRAGRHYARRRNYDLGPDQRGNVSALSPWIRHRLITEEEVLTATLARHAPSTAEKFVQEVFWRTYFKGWLEQRPSVWRSYQDGLATSLSALDRDPGLMARYTDAIEGRTGIDCVDAWAQELTQSGFLHNHARMWFASIWIFTLRLPWALGADFFLRHLLDGDPASNTLSWRWVAGLHTKGKTYLARSENIAKYTDGRFRPKSLSPVAEPLIEDEDHPKQPPPAADLAPDRGFLLLITEDDCEFAAELSRPAAGVLGLTATEDRSPRAVGAPARHFATGAVANALQRFGGEDDALARGTDDWAEAILNAARAAGVRDVVCGYAPVGPVADRIAKVKAPLMSEGVALHQLRRDFDALAWPYATKGFFALKQKIPHLLKTMRLTP